MSAVPDFGALAQQQQQANDAATARTNAANRPNQYGPMGSVTWTPNPDGGFSQNTNLSGAAQGVFDSTLAGQGNLAGQIGQGVDFGSLPAMPDSSFGASQQVIDAWNALQQPGLQKSADAARARAAAMGLTIGSNASNDIENTIGTNEATSRNQGILQGTQEYQNVFNRGLSVRQQAEKEAMEKYNAAISGSASLGSTRNSLNPNDWLAKVPAAAASVPQNIYGAALDTFSANQANENAQRAQSNADRSATVGAVNTGLNAANQIGWGNLWSGAKGLWDWASGGSSSSTPDWGNYSGGGDYSGYTTGSNA